MIHIVNDCQYEILRRSVSLADEEVIVCLGMQNTR